MPARLIESLATTEEMAAVFSDDSLLQAMLDFESALARAEARVGVIPESAAAAITKAAVASNFDSAEIARQTLRAGTPGIPLVKALTERVRISDAASAGYVHWGTTSQDVADTAMILLLRSLRAIFWRPIKDVSMLHCAIWSDKHADTVMLGRTLLQPAPPITFGLKAAQWRAAICRGWKRVSQRLDTAMVLEFGGASGTLAALGTARSRCQSGSCCGTASERACRALACISRRPCGIDGGAWDLRRQPRKNGARYFVAHASRSSRGSPNPVARDVADLQRCRISGIPLLRRLRLRRRGVYLMRSRPSCRACCREHQRAAGGWQAEWAIIATVMQLAAVALASMREVAEGLVVYPQRMRQNIDATRGAIFAERAMMMIADRVGRDEAHQILEQASTRMIATGRTLDQVLQDMSSQWGGPPDLPAFDSPEGYLGSAEQFRKRLLNDPE